MAWLGLARTRVSAVPGAGKATGYPWAGSQGSGLKCKVAGQSPPLARVLPRGREGGPGPKFAKFSGRPGRANAAAPGLLFAPGARPGPWEVCFGVTGPSKKSPGRRGAPPGPPICGVGDEGVPAPRAQRKGAPREGGMTLDTRGHFRVAGTPMPSLSPPLLSASAPVHPLRHHRCPFCFSFKRLGCTRPRRGRLAAGAQPFPPRPGPPCPPGPADGWPQPARSPASARPRARLCVLEAARRVEALCRPQRATPPFLPPGLGRRRGGSRRAGRGLPGGGRREGARGRAGAGGRGLLGGGRAAPRGTGWAGGAAPGSGE